MRRRTVLLGGAALAAGGMLAGSFLRMGTSASYAEAMAELRAPLRGGGLKELVRFATLAANNHNAQPWRFRAAGNSIRITPDISRRTPAVDPNDHHLFVSLGCAAENLALASAAAGKPGELRFDTAHRNVIFDFTERAAAKTALFDAIPQRQSTRAEYSGQPVTADALKLLEQAAGIPGVDIALITDRPRINRVRELVVAGNSSQMLDGEFVAELKSWIRFNPHDALESGDGIYSATGGNPVLPGWLGRRLFEFHFEPEAENDRYARQINSSSGIAVIAAEGSGPEHWVRAGRACQRFALQATALGLKHAFINQPVEISALRPILASLAGMKGRQPNAVLRFGYGPTLPFSPRRPAEAVIES